MTHPLINARADKVIGQRNFFEMASYSPARGDQLNNPIGVFVDTTVSPPLLYINDSGNNRILVYHWDSNTWNTTTGVRTGTPTPVNVLGQNDNPGTCAANGDTNFTTFPTLSPAGAGTLSGQQRDTISPGESDGGAGMSLAPDGGIWTPDFFNHRVLHYQRGSAVADMVLGQADFTGYQPNRGNGTVCSASSLYFSWNADSNANSFMTDVCVDPVDGHVWVADSGNHRVLRFPCTDLSPYTVSGTADIVIGQGGSFTARASGNGATSLSSPVGLCLSADRKTLYIADAGKAATYNGWVRKYVSLTAGFNPAVDTNLSGTAFGAPTWQKPMSVDQDVTNHAGQLWIYDALLYTLYLLNESDGSQVANSSIGNGNANVMGDSGCTAFDAAGNVFFTSSRGDHTNSCMFVKAADIGNVTPGTRDAPVKLFDQTVNVGATGLSSIHPIEIAGDQLVVGDYGRAVFYTGLASLRTGQPADGYLTNVSRSGGASSFTVRDGYLNDYYAMAADKNGHLWIASYYTPDPCICMFTYPLSSGDSPALRITGLLNYLGDGGGAGTVDVYKNWGIAVNDDSSELWVTQKDKNRALRIRNPLTAPVVDCVLGQGNLTNIGANRGTQGTAFTWTLGPPGTLHDTGTPGWTVNDYAGATVDVWNNLTWTLLASGTIASNTADTLTLTGAWTGDPTGGLLYDIQKPAAINTMYAPGGINLDANGNLFVSDHSLEINGNQRLLRFAQADIPSGNGAMIYGPDADKIFAADGGHPQGVGTCATWRPVFDPNSGAMVTPYNRYSSGSPAFHASYPGAFPGVYTDPLGVAIAPDGFLGDFLSLGLSCAFDSNGNFYLADTRNRVLIYSIGTVPLVETAGGKGWQVRPIYDHQADLRRGHSGDVLRGVRGLRDSIELAAKA